MRRNGQGENNDEGKHGGIAGAAALAHLKTGVEAGG